jgi:hypothetical protein
MTGAQVQRMFRLGRVSISFKAGVAKIIPEMTNTDGMGMSYFYPRENSLPNCQMVDFFKTDVGKAYIGRYNSSIARWWPLLRIFCRLPPPDHSQKPLAGDPDQRPAIALAATYIERVEARRQYSVMCWVMSAAIFLGVRWAPASNRC